MFSNKVSRSVDDFSLAERDIYSSVTSNTSVHQKARQLMKAICSLSLSLFFFFFEDKLSVGHNLRVVALGRPSPHYRFE